MRRYHLGKPGQSRHTVCYEVRGGETRMTVDQQDRRVVEYIPLSQVIRAPRNPKLHAERELQESLDEFGMADLPVIDERTGRLVSGHGRLDALEAMVTAGDDRPEGIPVDPATGEWMMPVIRGWASRDDAHAEAYLLLANQTTIAGGWDDAGLALVLRDLAAADSDLLAATAFGDDRIEELLASLDEPEHVHGDIPATDAQYAETEDQAAAREERTANHQARTATGLTEMILVYPVADRDEAVRHIGAARQVLGVDLRAGEVVLRALRTLMAILDGRDGPGPVDCARLARHAGWEPL